MEKLSKNQQRVLNKLTDKWQSAYELQESRKTLDSLANQGLIQKWRDNGYLFCPRIAIKYRRY